MDQQHVASINYLQFSPNNGFMVHLHRVGMGQVVHATYDNVEMSITRSDAKQDAVLTYNPQGIHKQHNGLSLLSYNIQNLENPWRQRLNMIAKIVGRLQPDVIALQEVRMDETKHTQYDLEHEHDEHFGHHQMRHLFGAFRVFPYKSHVFQPAMSYLHSVVNNRNENKFVASRSEEGLAIISQYTIDKHSYHLLSRNMSQLWSTHQRILLQAEWMINTTKVQLINTHLNLEDEIRQVNWKEIVHHVDSLFSNEPLIQIICGDMNQEYVDMGSEQQKYSANALGYPMWRDAWIEYCTPRHMCTTASGLTFSTNEHYRKRIDYVFFRSNIPDLELKQFEIVGKNADPQLNLFASDHMGVFVDFKW